MDGLPPSLAGVTVGVIGTGMMASAHAFRHSQLGLPVVIGSRDADRAKDLAGQINRRHAQNKNSTLSLVPPPPVLGGTHAETLERANFIILAVPPTALKAFFDQYREQYIGKSKSFIDLSVTFSRYGSPRVQPPAQADGTNWRGPYFDMVSYLKDRVNDEDGTHFAKAWHNLYYKSIMNNKVQPVECGGDAVAKQIAMDILAAEGWEPLDCGGIQDLPKIETGFHERRVRHPRHLEFNGPDHP
eukprot:g6311.t1